MFIFFQLLRIDFITLIPKNHWVDKSSCIPRSLCHRRVLLLFDMFHICRSMNSSTASDLNETNGLKYSQKNNSPKTQTLSISITHFTIYNASFLSTIMRFFGFYTWVLCIILEKLHLMNKIRWSFYVWLTWTVCNFNRTHDFHVALSHMFYVKYVIYHAESKCYVWLK